MNLSCNNFDMKPKPTRVLAFESSTHPGSGFTLLELLVILAMLGLLVATLLPAMSSSSEKACRAQCASNFRQIGAALSLYSADNNAFLPQRNWPQNQLPWHTSEQCRCTPGTSNITRGPYNLAPLYFSGALKNAKSLYCPSRAKLYPTATYEYYTAAGVWPSPQGVDDNVRSSYDYYPQSKDIVTDAATGFKSGALTYVSMAFKSPYPADPVQITLVEPAPLKLAQIDLKKSVAVDDINSGILVHHDGVNAVFADGHVTYQSTQNNPTPLKAQNLSQLSSASTAAAYFRMIMYQWQP
jgi:prepilin-type processing-associated H-X9-DG protein